jgi:hypothetical protein
MMIIIIIIKNNFRARNFEKSCAFVMNTDFTLMVIFMVGNFITTNTANAISIISFVWMIIDMNTQKDK